MREPKEEIVKVKGPNTIVDENCEVVEFEIKALHYRKVDSIIDKYRSRKVATDKKGNPLIANGELVYETNKDMNRAMRHVMVEALVYPDLKDKELMAHFSCNDITEMPYKVFQTREEYDFVLDLVLSVIGKKNLKDNNAETEIEDAKN